MNRYAVVAFPTLHTSNGVPSDFPIKELVIVKSFAVQPE